MRTVVVQGAAGLHDVPQLEQLQARARFRFVGADEPLDTVLPGAEVLLGWDFRAGALHAAWPRAGSLRWVHWSGAGVDAVLFPELASSAVALSNARGVFDVAMAEYVTGLVLAFAKGLPETIALQREQLWRHRLTERVEGRTALLVGVGSIGRAIARRLRGLGMRVEGVGRGPRGRDPDFERLDPGELHAALGRADYVVIVCPLTPATRGLIGAEQLRAMQPQARLINVGRGPVVDEAALLLALEQGWIAGAALDVFDTEPLPPGHPLWSTPNVIVSPHMSGDFVGFAQELGWLFVENFRRYERGERLLNLVDKARGY